VKGEVINPASLMLVIRSLELVVRVRFGFVRIKEVRVNQGCRISVIIVVMGMK
jgi:hypothetical protein